MGLTLKVNGIMLLVFLAGFAAAGAVSRNLLEAHARQEAVREARLMLDAATAIRKYTLEHVQPHLTTAAAKAFLPQSVPAFAATETINSLRSHHAQYSYKEAALNPTNPRNRTADWEADVVERFRQYPQLTEIVAERPTPAGHSLFIAKPIQVTHAACLHCHGTPAAAPPGMLHIYGQANGFGWKPGEIVGAQIVNVPLSITRAQADRVFTTFMGSLAGVFLALFLAVHLALRWLVLRPLRRMSQAAERVSTGDFTEPEFAGRGHDEIALLGQSFDRMRRSLAKAMDMLQAPARR